MGYIKIITYLHVATKGLLASRGIILSIFTWKNRCQFSDLIKFYSKIKVVNINWID